MRVGPCPRRALLAGVGAAGLGALLSACGGDAAGQGAGSGSAATTAAPPPVGDGPTSAVTEPTPEPAEPDGALVRVDEVPVRGGVLAFGDVLVVQPTAGTFRAYDAVCPHQGVVVDPPDASGVITCSGHLSRFRASDGSRIDGQAPRGLRRIEVRLVDGYVVRI